MKKYVLKKWVKVALTIIGIVVAMLLCTKLYQVYSDMFRNCDNATGHICDLYEARDYANR